MPKRVFARQLQQHPHPQQPHKQQQLTTHLHGVDEHPREAEGHLLRELVSLHGHLEAVAEVDVHHPTGHAVHHDVAAGASGQKREREDAAPQ